MGLHLAEIANTVKPGAHAVLLLDQAGWHLSTRLVVPPNITIIALPPKSPELNPMENIWQFVRDNWLSNRIFASYEDLLEHCCEAWNRLVEQPWKIMSIGFANGRMGADQWDLVEGPTWRADDDSRATPGGAVGYRDCAPHGTRSQDGAQIYRAWHRGAGPREIYARHGFRLPLERPGLSAGGRRIVTLAALIARSQTIDIAFHIVQT